MLLDYICIPAFVLLILIIVVYFLRPQDINKKQFRRWMIEKILLFFCFSLIPILVGIACSNGLIEYDLAITIAGVLIAIFLTVFYTLRNLSKI